MYSIRCDIYWWQCCVSSSSYEANSIRSSFVMAVRMARCCVYDTMMPSLLPMALSIYTTASSLVRWRRVLIMQTPCTRICYLLLSDFHNLRASPFFAPSATPLRRVSSQYGSCNQHRTDRINACTAQFFCTRTRVRHLYTASHIGAEMRFSHGD